MWRIYKRKMNTTAFFTQILSWLTGIRLTVDNSVVRELDFDSFLGSWYEVVVRFDHFFERGMSQTKANYVLREDGNIGIISIGIKDGKSKTAKGKAKLTDNPTLFRVSFFGPFYSDYRYMLIGSGPTPTCGFFPARRNSPTATVPPSSPKPNAEATTPTN